ARDPGRPSGSNREPPLRIGARSGSTIPHFKEFDFAVPVRFGMVMNQTNAAIPAQDSFVIPRRTNSFGLFVAAHGLLQENQKRVRWPPGAKLCFSAPFMQ